MIPVEVTQTPWHYTTFWDWLDHWQTLIAGVLAFVAGVGTVVAAMSVIAATREQTATTVRLERERVSSEVDALRKSLAVELRLQITRAVDAYDGLRELSSTSDGKITASLVESKSQMSAPIIYSANAGKIGFLKDDAVDVVLIYTILEGARGRVDRLATRYITPDDINRDVVMRIAKAFLKACEYALEVLPRLRTGNASYDAEDEALIQRINAALAARRA